jgi:hypothetical protein
MPNAVLSALGKGQDRTPTSKTPPKQNACSPLYFLHASKKSFVFCFKTEPFSSKENVSLGICNNFFGSDRTPKNFVLPVLARYLAAFQTWKSG